jgi:hypothetical protein
VPITRMSRVFDWLRASLAPVSITPKTGTVVESLISFRASAEAVLQAITRKSAPWSSKKRVLESA